MKTHLFLSAVGLLLVLNGMQPVFAADKNTVALPPLSAATQTESAGPPNPLPPSERVGFAVVGLGHLALEQIIPAFAESKNSRLAALVSGDLNKAQTIARQYGLDPAHCYTYKTFEKLKDDPTVQVIYIVLPNNMHKEYVLRAAAIGKDVLCEKPMATSVADAQAMVDAMRKAGRKLMIAYRLQYEPYNKAMIALTRNSTYGDLKGIECDNSQDEGDPTQWRLKKDMSGGGPVPDVGIYCINAARYITGLEPTEIFAMRRDAPTDPRFHEVEEQMNFIMRFPNGVMANVTTGYGSHRSQRYRLDFADGWAELDPAFPYSGLHMKVSYKQPKEQVDIVEERHLQTKSQFADEMDAMADNVLKNTLPHTPGEEGLQDMKIIAAIYKSAQTHQPVLLPRDSDEGYVP